MFNFFYNNRKNIQRQELLENLLTQKYSQKKAKARLIQIKKEIQLGNLDLANELISDLLHSNIGIVD